MGVRSNPLEPPPAYAPESWCNMIYKYNNKFVCHAVCEIRAFVSGIF